MSRDSRDVDRFVGRKVDWWTRRLADLMTPGGGGDEDYPTGSIQPWTRLDQEVSNFHHQVPEAAAAEAMSNEVVRRIFYGVIGRLEQAGHDTAAIRPVLARDGLHLDGAAPDYSPQWLIPEWAGLDGQTPEMEPVGLHEISRRLGVTRQTADNWRTRGVLPEPRWQVGGRPAWDWSDIEAWARETGRLA